MSIPWEGIDEHITKIHFYYLVTSLLVKKGINVKDALLMHVSHVDVDNRNPFTKIKSIGIYFPNDYLQKQRK